jgi:alpha-tubulin suppressor-like RCC1 family protein
MRRVCAGKSTSYAIGEAGELFSWGGRMCGLLGHGDKEDQPSPKRVETLRGVRMSTVEIGDGHALALAEDGQVYAWGGKMWREVFGDLGVDQQLVPELVEALRGVRVCSVAAGTHRSHAVADTGEALTWGYDGNAQDPHGCYLVPLSHDDEQWPCPQPEPVESLQGIKVDAIAAITSHALALANDVSVYSWTSWDAEKRGGLGSAPFVKRGRRAVPELGRIAELRAALPFGRS